MQSRWQLVDVQVIEPKHVFSIGVGNVGLVCTLLILIVLILCLGQAFHFKGFARSVASRSGKQSSAMFAVSNRQHANKAKFTQVTSTEFKKTPYSWCPTASQGQPNETPPMTVFWMMRYDVLSAIGTTWWRTGNRDASWLTEVEETMF